MRALYIIEEQLSIARGEQTDIEAALYALEYAYSLVPQKKSWRKISKFLIILFFGMQFFTGLTDSRQGGTVISIMLGGAWLFYSQRKFDKQKNKAAIAITEANAQFESVVTKEISSRPTR